MNQNIQKLYGIANKKERLIVGLMSGTSMDGLDVALCKFRESGSETDCEILNFETVAFSDEVKTEIRKIFAKKTIEFQDLCLLNPWLGNLHGQIVLDCLHKWGVAATKIDLIASHGQTVYHAPRNLHSNQKFPNSTLQIGDGDHVAVTTGIITVSDFRQKHCAAGGEGAPLAVYGDYLLFSNKNENRLLLNIGGIANFTYLPSNLDANAVLATDTGTGNTLIDAYVQRHFGLPFDADAKIAQLGQVHKPLLNALKSNTFFKQTIPKTTGPELFNLHFLQVAQTKSNCENLDHQDILATLCAFSAETIAQAILDFDCDAKIIYCSGGGAHNPMIMNCLKSSLPNYQFTSTNFLKIAADAKEAVLFATLANEAVAGGDTYFGSKKEMPSVSLGKISFPN